MERAEIQDNKVTRVLVSGADGILGAATSANGWLWETAAGQGTQRAEERFAPETPEARGPGDRWTPACDTQVRPLTYRAVARKYAVWSP